MISDELKKHLSKLGRKGGKARLKKMTPEERQKIAREGGIARAKKAKKKQAGKSIQDG